ncbi:MAG: hypothetical protein K6A15_08220 [Treponema sp.]|nr:hypothetical protein [Treponema sp.]
MLVAIKKNLKKILAACVILFSAANLFALEEYVTDVYKQIDDCFSQKSEEKLYAILSKYSEDKYYYLMENYTQKKVRRLIVNNEYDFAMEAILVVIENNLDNEEAVEMYSVISDAYEIQRKHELELAHQKELEEARLQLEKEKQRTKVDKEYVSVKTKSGTGAYVSEKESKLSSYHWKAALGVANLAFLMNKENDLKALHYGISVDFRYEYTMKSQMVLGTDIFGGVQFLGLIQEDEKKIVPYQVDLDFALKLAAPQISKNLFIRAGLDVIIAGDSKKAVNATDVIKNFYTPILGIKMERIKIGPINLDIGADWLAGHLFADKIDMAFGGAVNVELPFVEMEKIKLNFNIGARDRLFLKKGNGMENRASVILAIGVENVVW